MLQAYRMWLESELRILGNASHHAYSFGQANMAKRAIEKLDQEIAGRIVVLLERDTAEAARAALSAAGPENRDLYPALTMLTAELTKALEAAAG